MAYFQYQSETSNDCLLTSFKGVLENAGLLVSDEFSSDVQVFAESQLGHINYKTKVKVFISWNRSSESSVSKMTLFFVGDCLASSSTSGTDLARLSLDDSGTMSR